MPGRWISWQPLSILGRRGRWTSNHHTEDGRHTLCGIRIPDDARDATTVGVRSCPRCWVRLNRRRAAD